MTFHIVTHQRWLAEWFAPAGGVQSFGLDVDATAAAADTWWASGAWMAGARRAGVTIPVCSAGPDWITSVPAHLLGRRVFVGTPDESAAAARRWGADRVWAKLPEAKTDNIPAKLMRAADLRNVFSVPEAATIQVSEPLGNLAAEARFFCAPDGVSAGSLYLFDGAEWGSDALERFTARNHAEVGDLLVRMRGVAEAAYRETPGPAGYVIDAAVTSSGRAAVLEANAAWSSNPYDTDPHAALATIEASHDRDGTMAKWLFDTAQVPPPWPRVTVTRRESETNQPLRQTSRAAARL